MSPGNGHPYSWSAICNGFDWQYMKDCPFPVIPQYLSAEKYPDSFIGNAQVTHIWTQSKEISEHVAKASRIQNIVDNPADMIDQVDAILFARDDAENHYEMCKPFIESGKMIYIDKPLAFDMITANRIYALQKFEGQIFSCSAMKYAREIDENWEQIQGLGKISYIAASSMKKWDTYSAHVIDPVLRIIGDNIAAKQSLVIRNGNTQGIVMNLDNDITVDFVAHKSSGNPIRLELYGDKGNLTLELKDTFYAFRGALIDFIKSVQIHKSTISELHIKKLVEIIELGNK